MTRRQWLVRGSALLFFVLLALNLYVFFTREWESSFFPASYATLYYPLDVPTIRDWKLVARNRVQLNLACTDSNTEWNVLTDGGKEQKATGMSPSFVIDTTLAALHTYKLIPVARPEMLPVEISIQFYGEEFYGSLGMKHNDVYIVRSNVPCGQFEQLSVNDWVDDYKYVGEAGLAETDRIVHNQLGIRDTDPTLTRIEKLFPYLRKKLKGSGGVPKDAERWMDPYRLFGEMAAGTGKGWCTQNAQVYVYWANRAGIPTRFVFGARTQDDRIVYTGHSWAESYIREQHRWAFVDLSQGQLYVTDRDGQVLNTAQIFHLNQLNAFDSTFVTIYADWGFEKNPAITAKDTLAKVPFNLCNKFYRSEFNPQSIIKYRRPPNVEDVREIYAGFFTDRTFLLGNIERYLFKPQLAYSLYPTEGGHTYLVRRALFFTMVAILILWMGLVVTGRLRKPKV
ncbi:MAG: transglutaminase-like domain-containing protein [Ignavibacteriales bacterium]|nr:transglutaminase-like domain-containing protein [Ignavibacteriales bacterium]